MQSNAPEYLWQPTTSNLVLTTINGLTIAIEKNLQVQAIKVFAIV